jgi:uncharacterized membrane protein YjgN (DUF898 family)
MGTDGQIDYSRYTRAQLEDAVSRIDRNLYPLNYQRLLAELERRRAAEAEAAAAAAAADPRPPGVRYRPQFQARPEEYFRIWIVNLALTILTLGIYSAWAKVRKLRYFYSSTTLAGSAFGYHADPVRILKGRLIAAVLAAAYFGATRISPIATLIAVVVIALAMPWLLVKSRMFTMRVTSWRGLRFDFAPDYAGAYRTLLGWGLVGIISLGFMMPRFVCERYRFIVTRGRYGSTAFGCNPRSGRFFKTMWVSIGLGAVMGIALVILTTLVGGWAHAYASAAIMRPLTLGTTAVLYAVMVSVIHAYTHSRNLNEVFDKTSLGANLFVSSLSATDLAGIYISNLFLIIVTCGLYTPWAEIRLARYRLESLELEAHGSLDEFVAATAASVPAAAGEEIGSFFDLDFGF